jgi:rhodanese-related sulfurtransferase
VPTVLRPLLAIGVLLVALVGCTGGSDMPDLAAMAEERVLIDVRTADEVAGGALEGAIHADLQSGEFRDLVADLPRDEGYFVYCRTGNRSGQAIEIMREMGFTDLVNGGAYADLAAAGLPTT